MKHRNIARLALATALVVPATAGASVDAAALAQDDFVSIEEFSLPTANAQPIGIVAGPDGAVWFAEFRANKIGRIGPDGGITEYPIPTPNSSPDAIVLGSDGALWFTEVLGNKIGRIDPATKEITEYLVPRPRSRPTVITLGPDGNLWFTLRGEPREPSTGDHIGRITYDGAITLFPVLTLNSRPLGITAGPDGNVWFSLSVANKVGRITPDGVVTEFSVPTPGASPWEMTLGPDGNIWFSEILGNKVARMAADGSITEFALPNANSAPNVISRGPDPNAAQDCVMQRALLGPLAFDLRYGSTGRSNAFGNCVAALATTENLYFAENGLAGVPGSGNRIGRITTDGLVSEFAIPTPGSGTIGVTRGPDNAVWFTETAANKIGRLAFDKTVRTHHGDPPAAPDSGAESFDLDPW
jgi:streptogramin lyase